MQREQGAAPGGFGSSVSYQQELELQQMLMGMAGFEGAGYLGVDPDQMSYEELTALGEAIGTVKTGVPAAVLDSMPCSSYRKQNSEEGEPDPSVQSVTGRNTIDQLHSSDRIVAALDNIFMNYYEAFSAPL
eukprot:Gb_32928 [translate_table: standard]